MERTEINETELERILDDLGKAYQSSFMANAEFSKMHQQGPFPKTEIEVTEFIKPGKIVINIDHHITNKRFYTFLYCVLCFTNINVSSVNIASSVSWKNKTLSVTRAVISHDNFYPFIITWKWLSFYKAFF